VALIIAVLLLLLISGVGIAAIEHSGQESAATGSRKRTTTTFYAADAAIQYATNQLGQSPAILDPFQLTLADGTTIRSGPRAAPAAQPLTALGTGPPPDGACINLGGSCFRSDLYRATVSALGPASGAAELEGQYSVVQAGTGGYR
jgi:hypothetical protein